MRDPPGGEHMIDPVSGGATATATASSRLQLVTPSSPNAGGTTSTTPTPSNGGGSADSAQPSTRVYVDRSESGIYVYRLVDVATGRVLAELPREASQSLKVLDAYAPGAVTSASA